MQNQETSNFIFPAIDKDLKAASQLSNPTVQFARLREIYIKWFVTRWHSLLSKLGVNVAAEKNLFVEEEAAFKNDKRKISTSLDTALENIKQKQKEAEQAIDKKAKEINDSLTRDLHEIEQGLGKAEQAIDKKAKEIDDSLTRDIHEIEQGLREAEQAIDKKAKEIDDSLTRDIHEIEQGLGEAEQAINKKAKEIDDSLTRSLHAIEQGAKVFESRCRNLLDNNIDRMWGIEDSAPLEKQIKSIIKSNDKMNDSGSNNYFCLAEREINSVKQFILFRILQKYIILWGLKISPHSWSVFLKNAFIIIFHATIIIYFIIVLKWWNLCVLLGMGGWFWYWQKEHKKHCVSALEYIARAIVKSMIETKISIELQRQITVQEHKELAERKAAMRREAKEKATFRQKDTEQKQRELEEQRAVTRRKAKEQATLIHQKTTQKKRKLEERRAATRREVKEQATLIRQKTTQKKRKLEERRAATRRKAKEQATLIRQKNTQKKRELEERWATDCRKAEQRIGLERLQNNVNFLLDRWSEAHHQAMITHNDLLYTLTGDVFPNKANNAKFNAVFLGMIHDLPPPAGFKDIDTKNLLNSLGIGTARKDIKFVPPPSPDFWPLTSGGSLLLRQSSSEDLSISNAVNALLLRILVQLPPGKVQFVFIDPVGLGHNVAPLLRLSDHNEQLITYRAWYGRDHIHKRLIDLTEHIQNVIQKYLRTDFSNIDAYNIKAGELSEAYRILVIFDFPHSFDEESISELKRILQNGPRCGVFSLVVQNNAFKIPHDLDGNLLALFCNMFSNMFEINAKGIWKRMGNGIGGIKPERLPEDKVVAEIIDRVGEAVQGSLKVQVPYKHLLEMASVDQDLWLHTSVSGISVPLGQTGLLKVQTLRLGVGLLHHVLLVGRPGSGKSNLIHILITCGCRLYGPNEFEFYLIDFKKGVEFNAYAQYRLPHARVIAIESEREFGWNILLALDMEMTRRGEIFRRFHVNDIVDYRKRTKKKCARILLVIDEFQELFAREDGICSESRILLDRLVRQGRAFGIHVVLATQSLSNAGLERSTLSQISVRIALQCSDADSRLILSDDNDAAKYLSRPGEAIYNDTTGLVEGNKLFQVALLTEEERHKELYLIQEKAKKKHIMAAPMVFEGHEPANIETTYVLTKALMELNQSENERQPLVLSMWIGEPMALQPPAAAIIKRQSGKNLLVLSRDETQGAGVILSALISLSAQTRSDSLRYEIINLVSADAPSKDLFIQFSKAMPHKVNICERRNLPSLLLNLSSEVKRRREENENSALIIILTILGLQRARELRRNDTDFGFGSSEKDLESPNKALSTLLQDGPEFGVHTLIWCDSFASMERALDRNDLNEIGLRVSGPLSSQDSYQFFDDDISSRIEKPYRMIRFDNDFIGVYEQFRPYAIPSANWLGQFAMTLHKNDTLTKERR